MSEPPSTLTRKGRQSSTPLVLVLGLVACAIAISNQPYWLDEAGTAYKAAISSFREFWYFMEKEGGSVLQQPLYMVYIWAWEKVFGASEVALRAANIPWLLLGLLTWARAFAGRPLLRWGMVLAILTSAFTWYYLNEVRPYAMQIGASLAVMAALYRLGMVEDEPACERRWVGLLCVVSMLLAASFMFGMMFLGAYLGASLIAAPRQRLRHLAITYWRLWIGTGLFFLAMGLFYVWTVLGGSRGTSAGTTKLAVFFFIPYELFGFSGLGPGRLAIRGGDLWVFKSWLPLLALYGALLSVVLVSGLRRVWALTSRRTRTSWIVGIAAVAGFILTVGIAIHFRVLGRHCATLLPICLLLVGFGLAALVERGGPLRRSVVAGYVALSLFSCLSLRFAHRHAKDDYRSAAVLAREALAQGEIVWWNAYNQGAGIYRVPLDEKAIEGGTVPDRSKAMYVNNPPKGFEQHLPKPDLVLTSKPDLYDCSSVLADFLRNSGYQPVSNMVAFTAWRVSFPQKTGSLAK